MEAGIGWGVWRVLRDGAGEAAWNMALDEALLEAVAANEAPPTLRLYHWERSSVSLGRFQSIARTLNRDACEANGIPLVRRITGGRGILHGDDVTISIAAPVAALGMDPGPALSTIAIYERLAAGFLRAFDELGMAATLGACRREAGDEARGDCFAIISRADIVDASTGRKRLGSALHRRERWVLQQTSLPLHFMLPAERCREHAQLRSSVFPGATPESGADTGRDCTIEAVSNAIVRGFAVTLGLTFREGTVSRAERCRAENLMAQRYADPTWTYGERGGASAEIADKCPLR